MVIYALDLFGTAVFAVAGTLAAGRKRMDAFGVIVVAMVTAVGGGTLRDLVLDADAVFWVRDPNYLYVGVAAALVTFFVARRFALQGRGLLVADAFGLAVFTVIGTQKGLAAGAPAAVSVLLGVMTGVAGGIIRDVLCGEAVPLILRKEIYATASLAGAVVFAVLWRMQWPQPVRVALAVLVVLGIRLAALRWGFSLPVMRTREGGRAEG